LNLGVNRVIRSLPIPATTFVGRDRELTALKGLLRRDDVRLVTLVGPGGVGKTRLALQAAAGLERAFRNGVAFVSLDHVTDPAIVVPTIAQALGVEETAHHSIDESLADCLHETSFLLILDNVEQVAAAGPRLADIVRATPRLKVLLTSRIVLRLSGEHVVDLAPLALPDGRRAQTARGIARCESVRLFVERAAASKQDFALSDANAPIVAEICRRVDGLPLALELAAARLRLLPLTALLNRMEKRLPLLVEGPRDQPPRQRTLKDTIAWSYDLLTPSEQVLFRRIGIFRGCSLEAIEEICGKSDNGPGASSISLSALTIGVTDGIARLVDSSLLRPVEPIDGEARYGMLETIREFALDRLAASSEAPAIQRRHALYYLKLAERAEPELLGTQQRAWLACLEREHDNFREAIHYCDEGKFAEPAFRLAAALWWFWANLGHVREGRERLARLLDRFPVRTPSGARAAARAKALRAAGNLAEVQNDHLIARRYHEEALDLFRLLEDAFGIAATGEALGAIAGRQGDYPAARVFLQEAVERARVTGDPFTLGAALYNLAAILHQQGDYAGARQLLEEIVEVKRAAGLPAHVGMGQLTIALIAQDEGDLEAARSQLEQSLVLCREGGDRRSEGLAEAHLGSLLIALGEYLAAYDHLKASLIIWQELGDGTGIALVLQRFAELAAYRGRPERALRLAGAAASLRDSLRVRLSADSQSRLERALAPARQQLAPADALDAWKQGGSLSPDDVIALALDDRDLRATARNAKVSGQPLTNLTARERDIVRLIARGRSNRQIAAELVITEGTVANHVVHILNKLGCDSRTQIAVWVTQGQRQGEIDAALH
jgi:predicted ATPase/DNA-binding CsgD family transcriptional regulator